MSDTGARTSRKAVGDTGEAAARAFLTRRGWSIVATNVRFGPRSGLKGELDIVARDGQTLAFVEVKTRRGDPRFVMPAENVTPAKQRQIARLALAYANREGFLAGDAEETLFRFDVVTVVLAADGATVRKIELREGAFLAPDGVAG